MAKKDHSKIISILSYFVVGIVWYFVDESERKDNKAKFHVKQSLNLIIISIAVSIIINIFQFLSFIGWIVQLVLFVLWIIGLINAINMKQSKIPLIGEFADKYLTF